MPKMKTRRAAPASLREIRLLKATFSKKNLQREREILEKQRWFPNLITNA